MTKNDNYAVSVKDLRKVYYGKKKSSADKEALKSISLDIPEGSIFGLLGPNGAGKSTLINILAGLTLKTSGNITINGIDIDKDPRQTRFSLGIVPQDIVLDPFFTVEETLDYYAGYFNIPKAERRTEELLDALHLKDKAKANSRQLSGGMKRRVLIAKALVHNPKILILDEPTAGVDVELRNQLWSYVKKLNENGTTVLLTTHYLEEAENLCDFISIINDGEVIANESPSSLIKKLGYKKIEIIFKEQISNLISKFNNYDSDLIDNYTLQIQYKNNENVINELLNFTKELKLTIKDITTKEPKLEEVFTTLINQKHN